MNRLKELREKNGITQKAFANSCNIATSTYNQYETGKRQPDLETLKKLAEKLQVTVDYLLGGEEKEKPVHVDEPEQGRISPEKKILLSAFDRASDDDRRVLWTLLDRYLTPNEKQYFSQSEQENNVG